MRTIPILVLVGVSCLVSSKVHAQAVLRSRLQPVTTPLRRAGVFHVATGTWTRGASLASVFGPDVIYNNTCAAVYYSRQQYGEKWQHRACIPSPSHPSVPSQYYTNGNDEAPGCATSYTIQGFEFAYCSPVLTTPIDYLLEFASSYSDCSNGDLVPTVSFLLTGLPTCPPPCNISVCWIIDVDLTGSSQTFSLQADGDGTYLGPSTNEQFGWSLSPASPNVTLSTYTGPLIAGDFNWTGGPGNVAGTLTPCRGTDGTVWDSPIFLGEEGTGMASNDFFRATGSTAMPNGPGCYDFGGHPHADFWLKLFADTGCPRAMTSFCDPGRDGVIDCPCTNDPGAIQTGCPNSSSTSVSLGASLGASGTPSLAADTLLFTTRGEKPAATSILLQGTLAIPAGVVYGQGVRCVGGLLKRLFVKSASDGSITVPGPADPSVSARSAQRGDTILSGGTRHYLVFYRDPIVPNPCPATHTFNCTQSGSVTWMP